MLPGVQTEPVLECVPNFSEGRRREIIERIVSAVHGGGVHVLDVAPDPDHHRTVLTMAGPAGPVGQAALAATASAIELIDLRAHAGTHPRIGAMDVVPFVPVMGATMGDAVSAAGTCARRIWDELGVPCFLYGEASPDRRSLPDVRRGAFRSLVPDVGGPAAHPTAGAVCVGAREILVAFNVALATGHPGVAGRIARAVRQRSGGLPHVRALGFWLPSRSVSQVSMNLLRPSETTMADAYAAVARAARAEGVGILGAELVGLAPRAALGGRTPEEIGLRQAPRTLEDELARLFSG